MSVAAPKTVILAVAGMAWSQVQARISNGTLPGMAALRSRGVSAPVLQPIDMRPVALWPTIATGLDARDHGVVTREEEWAGGLRPSGRRSWRAAPYWERLHANGVFSMGVGWPSIRPGAGWTSVQVDDRLVEFTGATWNEWVLPPDVAAASLRDTLRDVRVHPTDITPNDLRPFVADLAAVDQMRDHRLVDITLALARFTTTFSALTAMMAAVPWQVATVHLDLLQTLQGRFAGSAPPFDAVYHAGWTLIDSAVSVLLASLPADTTLILFSPGQVGDAGTLLAKGLSLTAGVELPPMQVHDLAPSILARYGLAAPDLPGKVRLGSPRTLRPAPAVPVVDGPTPPDPADLTRVAAFGFEPPRPTRAAMVAHLMEQAEALIVVDPPAARRLAQKALTIAPDTAAAIGVIAASHASENDFTHFPDLADRMEAISPSHPWLPLIRAGYHASRGDVARAEPLLRQVERDGGPPEWIRAAAAWLMLRRPADARRMFKRVAASQPDSVTALIGIGVTSLSEPLKAEAAFARALTLDPNNRAAMVMSRRVTHRR